MHAKSRGLAPFCTRAKSVLGNAGHGIDHGIAKLKEFFLLLAREWVKPAFALMIVAH
jgi:hypothetical protein